MFVSSVELTPPHVQPKATICSFSKSMAKWSRDARINL